VRSIVCTQFEGDYHYGAAALINSLYKAGFRGELYAGYKGELPYWASKSKESTILDDTNHTLQVAEGLQVNFIKIKSSSHLTNYKPDFMKMRKESTILILILLYVLPGPISKHGLNMGLLYAKI
jgi:hypothetical protein